MTIYLDYVDGQPRLTADYPSTLTAGELPAEPSLAAALETLCSLLISSD